MTIYDNSNIAESYAGTTTPLTFSFARQAYQEVYKHFCRMMGVSEAVIQKERDMFPHMVEYVGNRMYYNLLNWYKLIALLPGYQFNREFLEKMLGVQKRLNAPTSSISLASRLRLAPRLLWQLIKIVTTFMLMGRLVRRFNQRFDRTLHELQQKKLSQLNHAELCDLYQRIARDLVSQWRIPIANDLAVMISTGIADKLSLRWIGQSVYPFLKLASHQTIVSLDPGKELQRLADIIRHDPELAECVERGSNATSIWKMLTTTWNRHPLMEGIRRYQQSYGSRTPNELKLESESLNEQPEMMVVLLRQRLRSSTPPPAGHSRPIAPPWHTLGLIRRLTLSWILSWANHSIARREETRFRRALIFGYARQLFLAMGAIFVEKQRISDARDIFWLTLEECLERRHNADWNHRITNRKTAAARWKEVIPPRRIETNQTIAEYEQTFLAKTHPPSSDPLPPLWGTIASTIPEGQLDGTALVVKEFDPALDYSNKILVTCQTDPGWMVVFPLLRGLIVERGGMLSHAAIASRELGIPCIVGVDRATDQIPNHSTVTIDLSNGSIAYA